MSSIQVLVSSVDSVSSHPNLDRLDVLQVRGNTVVAGKGMYAPGDLCIFIPGDALLPKNLVDYWDIEKFLQKQGSMFRVRPVHEFRGVKVTGMIQDLSVLTIRPLLGNNVAWILGIEKYEYPEIEVQNAPGAPGPEWFHKYTDIENIKNYPDVLIPGEPVLIAEKIHGTNSRIGYCNGNFYVGSHNQVKGIDADFYSSPLNAVPEIKEILQSYGSSEPAIVFGEIFGPKVQKGHGYGVLGRTGYKIFDISVGGKYVSVSQLLTVEPRLVTPQIVMNYDPEYLEYLMTKGSTVDYATILEGFVIRPVTARLYQKNNRTDPSRCIFKMINPAYKNRTGGTEFK